MEPDMGSRVLFGLGCAAIVGALLFAAASCAYHVAWPDSGDAPAATVTPAPGDDRPASPAGPQEPGVVTVPPEVVATGSPG